MQFKDDPFFNPIELRKKYLKALKEQDIETLLVKEMPKPPEDPRVLKVQADIEAQKVEVTAMAEKATAEMDKIAAQVADLEASTILKIAQAEAIELGPQMDVYMAQFQSMLDRHNNALQAKQEQGNDGQGPVSELGGAPADAAVSPVPQGFPAEPDATLGDGFDPGAAGATDGDGEMPAA
jgi:cellobiose-specific phosphotransferase system component IIB